MDQNQMMLEYLMEMGAMKPQEEAIAQKRALVQQLRQQGAQQPGMRTTPGAGGGPGIYAQPQIQSAPGMVEMLGSLAGTAAGAYQGQQADQMQQQYGADRRMGLEKLRRNMMGGQPQQQQPGFGGMDTANYGGGI